MKSGTRTLVMAAALVAAATSVAAPSVAAAQGGQLKHQPRRASVLRASHHSARSHATPTPAIQPVSPAIQQVSHWHAGCGCDAAPACGCEPAPTCGCEPAPTCGCEVVEPTCGCPTAPHCGCDPCCFRPLRALARGIGSVLDALVPCHAGCGYHCPVYPVGPCPKPHHRVGLLNKLGRRHHGCSSCGGCEPTCGCGAGGSYDYLDPVVPLSDPFLDDPEELAPPAPPEEARRAATQRMQYSSHSRSAVGSRPAGQTAGPVGSSVVRRTSHSESSAVARQSARASLTDSPATQPSVVSTASTDAIRQLPMRKHRELRRGSASDDLQTLPEPAELPPAISRPITADVKISLPPNGRPVAKSTGREIPVNPLRAR